MPSLAALSDAERFPRRGPRHQVEPPASRVALVCCETTAGPLSVAVRPRWAPRGAKRFMDMVRGGYFSSKVPLMRCVKGFLCQFGLPGIPSLAKAFGGGFPDDPSWLPHGPKHWKVGGVERFAKGYLAYAGAGPNSRGNQFIVSLAPSERLCGGSPWEVPWGEVVGGFGTLDAISTAYGEKGPSQGRLAARGAEGLEGPADVAPGETAVVVVVDLEAPGGPRVVRERPTRAWDGQLGAQVQWGASDDVVYCNDLDRDGAVAGVAFRWRENASEALPAPVYHVSRDGAWAASPADLGALRLTQPGYGVVPTPAAAAAARRRFRRGGGPDDGVVVADLRRRRTTLIPLRSLVAALGRPANACATHLFHVKWNANATRLMAVLRDRGAGCAAANHVVTIGRDGGDARRVATWRARGNHPNWLDDGRVSMNRRGAICSLADAENAPCETVGARASGHPIAAPHAPGFLVADTYAKEHAAFGLPPGVAALRLVDASTGAEVSLGSFPAADPRRKPDVWRCDLHPSFDRAGRKLAFNVRVNGSRAVAVMDFGDAPLRAVFDRLRAEDEARRRGG